MRVITDMLAAHIGGNANPEWFTLLREGPTFVIHSVHLLGRQVHHANSESLVPWGDGRARPFFVILLPRGLLGSVTPGKIIQGCFKIKL